MRNIGINYILLIGFLYHRKFLFTEKQKQNEKFTRNNEFYVIR